MEAIKRLSKKIKKKSDDYYLLLLLLLMLMLYYIESGEHAKEKNTVVCRKFDKNKNMNWDVYDKKKNYDDKRSKKKKEEKRTSRQLYFFLIYTMEYYIYKNTDEIFKEKKTNDKKKVESDIKNAYEMCCLLHALEERVFVFGLVILIYTIKTYTSR